MIKSPTFYLPTWPDASTSWGRTGLRSPLLGARTQCSTSFTLRSPDTFEAIYVGVRFQMHSDRRMSIEANLIDIHGADVNEWARLGKLLNRVQKAVDKALTTASPDTSYLHESQLSWFLTELFRNLKLTEVIEYRGIGVPDNVVLLGHVHVTALVSQLQSLEDREQLTKAA
jgi:hypothetical protein